MHRISSLASSVETPNKSRGSHQQLTSTIPSRRQSNDERYASSSWLHRTNTRYSKQACTLTLTEWIEEIRHLSKRDFTIPNEFDSGSTVMNGSFFRFVGLGGNNMTLSKREKEGPTSSCLLCAGEVKFAPCEIREMS